LRPSISIIEVEIHEFREVCNILKLSNITFFKKMSNEFPPR
jgi:hypothetical protein